METQSIIHKLKTTPYKYSTASKILDELKVLPIDLRTVILTELRIEKNKMENINIHPVLSQLLNDLKPK